jgi:hypothetical protein
MHDKITICLFSRECSTGFAQEPVAQEVEHIRNLYASFSSAALKQQRTAPQLVVSVLLIPDFVAGSMYTQKPYLVKKRAFLAYVQQLFASDPFQIEDFYESLFSHEKLYLAGISEGSNCIDMMKIKSIIENLHCRHLQLDSNTIITNVEALYLQTFNRTESEQADALNASFYGTTFITPHSKIVYTHPQGRMGVALHHRYDSELRQHGSARKFKKSNFYLYVFINALRDINLAQSGEPPAPIANLQTTDGSLVEEYRITFHILTVTNQSWANGPVPDYAVALLPVLRVGDIQCNANLIQSIIRKYVIKKIPELAHQHLLAISNIDFEMQIIRTYYERCGSEAQTQLVKLIPNNKLGKLFCRQVFLQELHTMQDKHGIQDPSRFVKVSPTTVTAVALSSELGQFGQKSYSKRELNSNPGQVKEFVSLSTHRS